MDALVVAIALGVVLGCVYLYEHVKDVRYRVLNAFVGQRAVLGVEDGLGRFRWVYPIDVRIQELHGGRGCGWISVDVLDDLTDEDFPFPVAIDRYETDGIPVQAVRWLRRPEGDEEWRF